MPSHHRLGYSATRTRSIYLPLLQSLTRFYAFDCVASGVVLIESHSGEHPHPPPNGGLPSIPNGPGMKSLLSVTGHLRRKSTGARNCRFDRQKFSGGRRPPSEGDSPPLLWPPIGRRCVVILNQQLRSGVLSQNALL